MERANRKPKGLQLIEERHGPFPQAYARLKGEGLTEEQIAERLILSKATLWSYRKREGVVLVKQPPLVSVSE